MEFEWDTAKAESNERKHGVSFAFASGVFLDEHLKQHLDERSVGEERWIAIGLVDGREIVVAYTLRDNVVRLISARGADKYEREDYWLGSV